MICIYGFILGKVIGFIECVSNLEINCHGIAGELIKDVTFVKFRADEFLSMNLSET